jgi:hypothetical protein
MALNKFLIKRWFHMLKGDSLLHVNQGVGKMFVPTKIEGYFNDLTEKVTRDNENIRAIEYIPQFETTSGEQVYFPVQIIQYGLGCYDLYLITKDPLYFEKYKTCVQWLAKHQNENGSLDAFSFLYPDAPYGAMCQGEAVSLFLRAYMTLGDEYYLIAARKAIDFMLLPTEEGGTAVYDGEDLYLLEYTHLPAVLNGWIFALFGIYELYLATRDNRYDTAFKKSLSTLKKTLKRYDNGYWTLYDLKKKIASPFYHALHIAQLQALQKIDGDPIWQEYIHRWSRYQNSFFKPKRAFIKKAIQKILE